MSETEVNVEIKMKLDTSPAKDQMESLNKKRARMRRKITSSVMRRMGNFAASGVGALGGFSAVNRVMNSRGPIDMMEAAKIPILASVQQFVDKQMGYSARGRMSAISMAQQKMAINSFFLKSTDDAKMFYNVVEPIEQQKMEGTNIVRKAMGGPDFEEVIAAASAGYVKLVSKAFSYFYDKIAG